MVEKDRRGIKDRRVGMPDLREVKVEQRQTLRRQEDKDNKTMYYLVLAVSIGTLLAIGSVSAFYY